MFSRLQPWVNLVSCLAKATLDGTLLGDDREPELSRPKPEIHTPDTPAPPHDVPHAAHSQNERSSGTGAIRPARIMIWIGLMVIALATFLTGGWCALAIGYRLPGSMTLRHAATGLAIALIVAANILIWTRLAWPAIAGTAILVGGVGIWWSRIAPSGNRNWMPDVARNVTGTLNGDQLDVQNVRNFNWRSDTDFDQNWESRSYRLSDVSNVDLIMSYWSGEAIAHTIVSFGFKDTERLDFSIETRKAQGQSYSTIAGFFKEYTLIIIAADERDVIRVRSNIRGEDVRIYRLRMTPAAARSLLLAYIGEANDLAIRPRFYNTATANCTTLVYGLVEKIHPKLHWDPRILISGYLPEYVYSLGALDNRIPFNRLRELAKIHDKAIRAGDDPNFSTEIRAGLPTPASGAITGDSRQTTVP